MQNEPPGYQLPTQSPQRSANRTLWIVAACIAVPCCGLLGFFGYVGIRGFREFMPFLGCVGTFHDLQAAMDLYAKDNKGRLPPGSKWQESLRPYLAKVPSGDEFRRYSNLESKSVWGCTTPDEGVYTGIAFNSALSEKVLADIKEPEKTPLLFEVPAGSPNLSQPYSIERSGKAPVWVFGQPRGWMEVDPMGKLYMLMQDEGKLYRVPLDDQGQIKKAMEQMKGKELKDVSAEPAR
ncbi:MAG: hypothetical protein WAO58_05890 [Fimbriimonadaceae bacterium]